MMEATGVDHQGDRKKQQGSKSPKTIDDLYCLLLREAEKGNAAYEQVAEAQRRTTGSLSSLVGKIERLDADVDDVKRRVGLVEVAAEELPALRKHEIVHGTNLAVLSEKFDSMLGVLRWCAGLLVMVLLATAGGLVAWGSYTRAFEEHVKKRWHDGAGEYITGEAADQAKEVAVLKVDVGSLKKDVERLEEKVDADGG